MKKRILPVIIAILLILVIAGGALGKVLLDKYSYSKEEADWNEFYQVSESDRSAIILQDEMVEEQALIRDDVCYFDLATVHKYMNEVFYADMTEKLLLYANPTEVIRTTFGETSYTTTEGTQDAGYVISFVEGDTVYVAADYVKLFTNYSYDCYDRHVQVYTEWGTRQVAQLKKDTAVRLRGGVKSPILTQAAKGDTLEILEQLPEVEQVVVPIGGGGLISGVAFAIKQLKPSCKVIGVQAGVVASMYASRQAGKVTTVPDAATLADGIHVLTPGSLTFEMCQKYVDEIVTVSEDEIAAAILALLEVQKTVAEGAGATPVAACMSGKVDTTKKTVCVVSGGNVDVTTLSRVITRGLTYGGRLATITTKLADRAGSLANLLNVVGGTGANVVRIHHEREDVNSEVNACVVSMVLETRNADHVQKIKDELTAKGYSLLDA